MARSVAVARTIRRQGAPVAHLVYDDGQAFSLHFTPEEAQLGGFGWSYATVERQGRKPLNLRGSRQLRTLGFTHTLGPLSKADRAAGSVTAALTGLIGVADSGRKVRLVNVSGAEGGWWWPQLSVNITARDTSQQVKTAELSWTLTEVVDERPKIARPPAPPPKPRPPAAKAKPMQPDYIVKSGDCLWTIAYRLLGSGTRWKEIYNLNAKRLNLAPPVIYHGLITVWIYPSQRLKIPAR